MPTRVAGPALPLAVEQDRLLACVHCGFCLDACPTYTRLGDEADSPRGRLYLMRAVMEGRIPPDDDAFVTHIDRCLGCRACEPVCPSGVEYGFLLERARASIVATGDRRMLERVMLAVFGDRMLMRVVLLLARTLRATGLAATIARALPAKWQRIRFALAMLAASGPTPESRLAREPLPGAATPRPDRSGGPARGPSVAVLTGCVQQGLFARVNEATTRVLRANGCTIVTPAVQYCCGALHAHGGDLDTARSLARANIAAFERCGADHIVVNAAGCGAMLKDYGELLERDAAWANRAAALAERARDVSELLAGLGVRRGAPLPLTVTYDAPCHLHHAQGVTNAPLELLRAIPQLHHLPLRGADECCGGAGTYGLTHPELGGRILQDKLAAIRETGAEIVVTPNPGCAMQIGAGLRLAGDDRPVLHPIELLDLSYRRGGITS